MVMQHYVGRIPSSYSTKGYYANETLTCIIGQALKAALKAAPKTRLCGGVNLKRS